MKRTWKDNLVANMRQQIKKHKYLKAPMLIGMIVITVFYNIGLFHTQYKTICQYHGSFYLFLCQQQFHIFDGNLRNEYCT